MVCRVCKREIDSPICSFCGEDNTAWIKAAEDSAEVGEKKMAETNERETAPGISVLGEKIKKYKIDYKKLIRLVIALVAVVAVVILAISLSSPDEENNASSDNVLFDDDMIAIRYGSEWGYISSEDISAYAIAPQYKHVTEFFDDIAFVNIGGKYAVIDKEGTLLTEPSFDSVGNLASNGYFAVKTGGKWGYIDKATMEFVVEPKFSTAGVFCDDCAVVSVNALYGYIGADGEYIIAPQYDFALSFSGDYAAIQTDGKWGYINKSGEAVIEPVYEEAGAFEKGKAIVKYYGDYGVIGTDGAFVIEPQFDAITPFDKSGLAKVKIGNKFGYINEKGEYCITPRFRALGNFNGEKLTYAAGGNGLYGFVDSKGKFVIEPQFADALDFSNGLAPVVQDGRWGYINSKGEMVIPPKFVSATKFYGDGYAIVTDETGKCQLIDKEGNYLFDSGVSADAIMLNN